MRDHEGSPDNWGNADASGRSPSLKRAVIWLPASTTTLREMFGEIAPEMVGDRAVAVA